MAETGGAEDDILSEMVEVISAQLQLGTQGRQFSSKVAQFFCRALVAGGHINALAAKTANQRRIADTDADDGDGLIFKAIYIFL